MDRSSATENTFSPPTPTSDRRLMIGAATLAVLLFGVAVFFTHWKKPSGIHYHAAFHVYRVDQRVDFSASTYMNIAPCGSHDVVTNESPAELQIEKAHLHENVGDVVHVHRAGAVWGDLFQNINYTWSENALAGFRADGSSIGDVVNSPIEADSRIVILIGGYTNLAAKQAALPTLERIREVESRSELCGT